MTLVPWSNVEMIEQQMFAVLLDDEKAYTGAGAQDVASVLGSEARQESLTRSNWVEPANSFQAFTHCCDPQFGKFPSVCRIHCAKGNVKLSRHANAF